MVDTPARAVAGHGAAWRRHGGNMETVWRRHTFALDKAQCGYMRGPVAARLPAKPARGLAIGRGGLIVLKLNKKLLGAAGALVTAVSLTVTGLTAASAS